MKYIAWALSLNLILAPWALGDSAAEKKALDIVCRQREVKLWQKQLATTKGAGKAAFIVTHDKGNNYTVQVMEDRPDHYVTFNFYHVDVRTGKVKKDF
jgi:hypothetical protein